ncbi:MAG: metallophosphoesterase [Bacteroidales bacterium]|nr:metallophosphoesterase [Bacteroidales bacterium]
MTSVKQAKRTLVLTILVCASLSLFAQAIDGLKAPVTFFLASDMGKNGYYKQKPVAELMGEMADKLGPECIVAAGDVFHYLGVQSVSDPLWCSNFENVFSHPELQVPWYPICGNHEYSGNTQAVTLYSNISRRWEMPAKYYTKVLTSKKTTVRLVFIDTPPLIDKYRTHSDKYPDACKEDMQAQLKWLEETLANAKEDWVIVVGHHPIYADTNKDESERTDMQKRVDSILRRYKVDFYICGHIHNFQHIHLPDSKIDYIVNTSGALARKNVKEVKGTKFCAGQEGFSVISAWSDKLTLSMIDEHGNILYQVTRNK